MQLYRGYIIEIAKKVGFASNNGESENQMEHDMENGIFWVFIGMMLHAESKHSERLLFPSKSSRHTMTSSYARLVE